MTDHARSEGARYERAAIRTRLRRRIKDEESRFHGAEVRLLTAELNWILARQKRYEQRPGGLGKTIAAKKDTTSRRR